MATVAVVRFVDDLHVNPVDTTQSDWMVEYIFTNDDSSIAGRTTALVNVLSSDNASQIEVKIRQAVIDDLFTKYGLTLVGTQVFQPSLRRN